MCLHIFAVNRPPGRRRVEFEGTCTAWGQSLGLSKGRVSETRPLPSGAPERPEHVSGAAAHAYFPATEIRMGWMSSGFCAMSCFPAFGAV